MIRVRFQSTCPSCRKILFLGGNLIVKTEIIMLMKEDLNMDAFKDFWLVFQI